MQEAENSNMRHRPIGIGVQGLADALVKLRLPYEGDAARQLNKDIFETIYYGACPASPVTPSTSSPSDELVSRLFSNFGPVRTASRPRLARNGPKPKKKPPMASPDGHESRRRRAITFGTSQVRRAGEHVGSLGHQPF